MQKLHLVGFTTDHDGLIFAARRGARWGFVVPLDDAILAALEEAQARRDAEDEDAQAAIAAAVPRRESSLTVKEVQSRLRAGRTIDDVAAEAGVEPAWVARFAAPVIAEQAQVIADLRAAVLSKPRLGQSAEPLGTAVYRHLAERGVHLTEEEMDEGWTTYQLYDSRWIIEYRYDLRGRAMVVSWEFDQATGEIVAADRLSAQVAYTPPAAAEDGQPAPARRSSMSHPPVRPVAPRPARVSKTVLTRKIAASKKAAAERAADEAKKVAAAAKKAEAARRAEEARKRADAKRQAAADREAARKATAARAAAAKAEAARRAAEEKRRAAEEKRLAAEHKAAEAAAAKKAAEARKRAEAKAAETARKRATAAKKAAAARKRAAAARKAATRKAAAAPAKRAAAKQVARTRITAKKATAKKSTAKKSTAKKTTAKKAAAKKGTAKKGTGKKQAPVVARAPAKKAKRASKPIVVAPRRPAPQTLVEAPVRRRAPLRAVPTFDELEASMDPANDDVPARATFRAGAAQPVGPDLFADVSSNGFDPPEVAADDPALGSEPRRRRLRPLRAR